MQELERVIEECHRSQLDSERTADMLRVATVRLKAELTACKQDNEELRRKNERLEQQLSEHAKDMDSKTPCMRTCCSDLKAHVKSAGTLIVQLSEKNSKLKEQLQQQQTETVNLKMELSEMQQQQRQQQQQPRLLLRRASADVLGVNHSDRHDVGVPTPRDTLKQECQRLRSRSELLEVEVQAKDKRCRFAEMESMMLREELEAVHRAALHLGPKNRKDGADLNMTI
jgi:hypothetical protein